jgi:hypothetical protein
MVKTWKDVELKFAKLFGTKRNITSGGNGHISRSDSLHPDFYIEIKHGLQCKPTSLWLDTVTKAKLEHKIPMIIQHFKGEKISDARITLKVSDFLKLASLDKEDKK